MALINSDMLNNKSTATDTAALTALAGQTVVIKYGGNAMIDADLQASVASDVAALRMAGMNPVVVHGGGPAISAAMKEAGIESVFIEGQRRTCAQTIKIVEKVLAEEVNSQIVQLLRDSGVNATGLNGRSGASGRMIAARKHMRRMVCNGEEQLVDLGFVGEVTGIDVQTIRQLTENGVVPVIAPIGVGDADESYNINADILAGAVAAALEADHLVYLTDIDGIRENPQDAATRLKDLSIEEVEKRMNTVITGGMIPKVESCLTALESGLSAGYIIDGTKTHSLMQAMLSPGISGTTIHA